MIEVTQYCFKGPARGYLTQNGLLFREWVAVADDCVGEAVFLLVVLTKFCPLVLKVALNDWGEKN